MTAGVEAVTEAVWRDLEPADTAPRTATPWSRVRVIGRPTPKGSIGALHVGRYPNCHAVAKESASVHLPTWQADVRRALHMQTVGHVLLTGPVEVDLVFVMPRPKDHRGPRPAIKRPDVDKLARAVLDCMTGSIYVDDSQVVDLHPRKRYARGDEPPGVVILVRAADDWADL